MWVSTHAQSVYRNIQTCFSSFTHVYFIWTPCRFKTWLLLSQMIFSCARNRKEIQMLPCCFLMLELHFCCFVLRMIRQQGFPASARSCRFARACCCCLCLMGLLQPPAVFSQTSLTSLGWSRHVFPSGCLHPCGFHANVYLLLKALASYETGQDKYFEGSWAEIIDFCHTVKPDIPTSYAIDRPLFWAEVYPRGQ